MSGLVGSPGWGAGSWGGLPWGGAPSGLLQLVSALATRENVIQLRFSRAVYWSGLLDVGDASRPSAYTVAVVAGSVGLDGYPVRPVAAVGASMTTSATDPALPAGVQVGQYVDVTLDRPMSPFPAAYVVSCSDLVDAASGTPLDTTHASFQLYGVFKQVVAPQLESPHPRRDFANPQSLSGLLDSFPNGSAGGITNAQLGTFGIDSTGDYAFDEGLTSLKKRVWRRLTSKPGSYAHLGEDYGVGIPQAGKHLASAAVISQLLARAESQIAQEPEVARVRVTAHNQNNGIVRFDILIRTKAGQIAKWSAPFPVK